LTLAWAFQTGQSASIKSTPIVVNGILYVSAPDQLWAIDARTARQVWQYRYPDNTGFHIGHRGVAVYKDSVFLTTPDAHLVALDARNGKVKWNVEIADCEERLLVHERAAPHPQPSARRRRRRLRQLPGILTSVDPETGKTQWVYLQHSPPARPARPAAAPPAVRCG
jgi:alcohol dehydrogenase (cytochrome c)